MNKKFISFIDFTNLNDEDKYKLLILRENKIDKAIELYENTPINCDGVAEDLLDKIIFDILKEEK